MKAWKYTKEDADRAKVTDATFYQWHHRLVWRTLCGLDDPGPYTLYMKLHGPQWDNLAAWIGEVWELDPTGCSTPHAAAVIRRCEVRRAIIHRAHELIRDAMKPVGPPEEYERILLTI